MTKIAKLITVSLMTRVIVDENATYDEIIKMAKDKLIETCTNDLGDNIEDIVDDVDMPCGEGEFDVYYQPDLNHQSVKDDKDFYSFLVFATKEKAKESFPDAPIIEYVEGDIFDPTFIG